MYNRIQIREILAWMALAIAMILFSVTIVFAQTKTINVENNDGKVHIKISKTENGQEIKIDTSFTYKYSHENDDETEGLKDEDHIVIIGNKDEKPPVLEKVISTKNGKQIFIYKRADSSKESGKKNISQDQDIKKTTKTDIRDLHYYPNPTGGKFKLTFHTDLRDDISIQVVDENGKEIFSEKITNFEGDYSKEIDLGNYSKGNYFLKIMQSGRSLTKKIVLN